MSTPTSPGTYIYLPARAESGLVAVRVEVVLVDGRLMVELPDGDPEIRMLPVANLPGRWTPLP